MEHFRHSTGATYLAGKVLENVKFWPSQPVESISLTVHPLQPFMDMCAQAMLWNDSTLIKIHGATLATPGNPMALVMDYLPHGPLNRFLQSHKDSVEKEDLLEAAVSLARALLHLEELNVVHGNIRLRNVLVAHYGEEGLKVKLGDPGQIL